MPRFMFLLSILMLGLFLLGGKAALNHVVAEDAAEVVENEQPAAVQKGLPNVGDVQLTARDLVLHADFESYAKHDQDATEIHENGEDVKSFSMVLHPSDIFDLHNMTMEHVSDLMTEEEIVATAAYFYMARLLGYKNRLSLNEEQKAEALSDIKAKGYDETLIAFDLFDDFRDFYLEKRQLRQDKKEKIVTALYNNMDVVGFIEFDQESRICDFSDQDKEKKCIETKTDLIRVLNKDEYKDHCEQAAIAYMGLNMTVDEAEYAAAYHMVIDHKKIKFMVDQDDYNRDDLTAYMDGVLKDFNSKGFSPEDKPKMKVAQGIRPLVMKLCVSVLGRYK